APSTAITSYPSAGGTGVTVPFWYRHTRTAYPLDAVESDQYTLPEALTTIRSTSPSVPFGPSWVSRPSGHSHRWECPSRLTDRPTRYRPVGSAPITTMPWCPGGAGRISPVHAVGGSGGGLGEGLDEEIGGEAIGGTACRTGGRSTATATPAPRMVTA